MRLADREPEGECPSGSGARTILSERREDPALQSNLARRSLEAVVGLDSKLMLPLALGAVILLGARVRETAGDGPPWMMFAGIGLMLLAVVMARAGRK